MSYFTFSSKIWCVFDACGTGQFRLVTFQGLGSDMQTLTSMWDSAVTHLCRLSNVTIRETVELSPGGVLMLTWWRNLLEHFQHQPSCPVPSAYSRGLIQLGTCPTGGPVCTCGCETHDGIATGGPRQRGPPTPEEAGTWGSALKDTEATSSHRSVRFSTSPRFHRNKRWDRTPRETPRGPQLSLVAKIRHVLARWARAWLLTELGLSWWTGAHPPSGSCEALMMHEIT